MAGYQHLDKYKGSLYGSPDYNGLEYDYEVPDNLVIASPGGASTTQHHWTKGMYGDGASRWDVYGGEGDRYPYGVYGGMYEYGQNAASQQGIFTDVEGPEYFENQSSYHKDNFEATADIRRVSSDPEFIGPPDTTEVNLDINAQTKSKVVLNNPWMLFLFLILGYIALDFWTTSGESFLLEKFHANKDPGWKAYAIYAFIVTVLVIAIAYFNNYQILTIEQTVV